MTITQISLKDPRVKIAVVTIIIIAGLFFLNRKFIVKPKEIKIQKLRSEMENIRLQNEIAGIYNEYNLFQKDLSPEKDPSWLLEQITSFAQASGLDVKLIEPQPSKEITPYTFVSFKINANCTYTQLLNFLKLVESDKTCIIIDKFILNTNKEYKLELSKEEIEKPLIADVEMIIGTVY